MDGSGIGFRFLNRSGSMVVVPLSEVVDNDGIKIGSMTRLGLMIGLTIGVTGTACGIVWLGMIGGEMAKAALLLHRNSANAARSVSFFIWAEFSNAG